MMSPLKISAYTASCAAGVGTNALLYALKNQQSYLEPCKFETVNLCTYVGELRGVDAVSLPDHLRNYDCRNNRLAYLALQQDNFCTYVEAASRLYGSERIGVFLGTSTSGMLQTELAYRELGINNGALPNWLNYEKTQNTFSVADFVRKALQLQGPAVVVSTACSSSAKVFAHAQRMISLGLIDAAVVGGVDSLCLTTLYGFSSLQLLSEQACKPFDIQRNGISIGEAAAFVLLEKPQFLSDKADSSLLHQKSTDMYLLSVGESSDAHHMSSPHPTGLGAQLSMRSALQQAGLEASEIDYINLHGTATINNDQTEGYTVTQLWNQAIACSSTKGITGHTLGAAGALEAIISILSINEQIAWGSPHTRTPILQASSLDYLLENRHKTIDTVLSNSFGFGGSNCSVLLGRNADHLIESKDIKASNEIASTLSVYIQGIGCIGSGIDSWQQLQDTAKAGTALEQLQTPPNIASATCLPSAERRRVGTQVRLALAVAQQALDQSFFEASALPNVFTSSSGEGENCHAIFEVLASQDRQISPTRFHNSVHNAPAGYWGIAHACMEASSSLCAFNASFAAGLLEAACLTQILQKPVLLVSYDCPYPQPLQGVRPMKYTFGVALLISPQADAQTIAQLDIGLNKSDPTKLGDGVWETLRLDNPSARALPLLLALADIKLSPNAREQSCTLEYLSPIHLHVKVVRMNPDAPLAE